MSDEPLANVAATLICGEMDFLWRIRNVSRLIIDKKLYVHVVANLWMGEPFVGPLTPVVDMAQRIPQKVFVSFLKSRSESGE